jgi:hypothetical protein
MGGVADGKMALDHPVSKGRLVSMIDGVVPCKLDRRFLNGAVPGDLLEYVPAWSGRIWRAGSSEYGPCIVRVYKGDWGGRGVTLPPAASSGFTYSVNGRAANSAARMYLRDIALRSRENAYGGMDMRRALELASASWVHKLDDPSTRGKHVERNLLTTGSTLLARVRNITAAGGYHMSSDAFVTGMTMFGADGNGNLVEPERIIKTPTGLESVNPFWHPATVQGIPDETIEAVYYGTINAPPITTSVANVLNSSMTTMWMIPVDAPMVLRIRYEDGEATEARLKLAEIIADTKLQTFFDGGKTEHTATLPGQNVLEVELTQTFGTNIRQEITDMQNLAEYLAAHHNTGGELSLGAPMALIIALQKTLADEAAASDKKVNMAGFFGEDRDAIAALDEYVAGMGDAIPPWTLMSLIKANLRGTIVRGAEPPFFIEHPAVRGILFGSNNIRPFGSGANATIYMKMFRENGTDGLLRLSEYLGVSLGTESVDVSAATDHVTSDVRAIRPSANMGDDSYDDMEKAILSNHAVTSLSTGAHMADNLDDGLYGTVQQQGAVSGALHKTRTFAEVEAALKLIPSSRRCVFAVFVGHKLGTDDFDIKLLFGGEE